MAMRALIQRVARAEVRVADAIVGAIDRGLLVLLGVREGDTVRDVEYLVSKVVTLRIFEDAQGAARRLPRRPGQRWRSSSTRRFSLQSHATACPWRTELLARIWP